MPEPLVDISGVSAFIPGDFERKPVLKNINWQFQNGCHAAIIGSNGAGKTSLLHLLHGDLRPSAGTISWRQNGVWGNSAIAAREICALVTPQSQVFCQIHAWDVTGLEFLAGAACAAPPAYANLADNEEKRRIEALLAILQAQDLLKMRLPAFSQGQLRLLLLARALLSGPKLLLLDEWSDGLDASKKALVARLLQNCSASMTMIFASHREDGLPNWIRQRLFMENGQLHNRPPTVSSGLSPDHAAPLPPSPGNGHKLVQLENVSVYIAGELALANINWTLRQGEHWRITGSNGSGKSTFLRLLAGDEQHAAGGTLKMWSQKLGRQVETLAEKRHFASLVSDLGQARYGYAVTGLELVLSGCDNSVGIYREFSRKERARAYELLRLFFHSPEEIAQTSIRRLSTGQLRRLFLARALISDPEILLLDEPCTGLDAESRRSFLDLLADMACGALPGVAPQMVFVSHYEEDAPGFVNRNARMDMGRLFLE